MDQPDLPGFSEAARVLALVEELHRRGYQRLRISPGLSPAGTSWRCYLTPASNTEPSNGAMLIDAELAALTTTAQGKRIFGWDDSENDSAEELAGKFVDRFPKIAKQSKGTDRAYLEWFSKVLRRAEAGEFPIAFADFEDPTHGRELRTVGMREGRLPLPPAEFSTGTGKEPIEY